MIEKDDESTVFESNPLGNRQRLRPRASFLARNAVQPVVEAVEIVDEATMNADGLIVSEHVDASHGWLAADCANPAGEHAWIPPSDDALVSGDHTISDVALPASSAVMLPTLARSTPMPSLAARLVTSLPSLPAPVITPVMLLPREIHYPAVATPYYPTDATGGFPTLASRRVRWLAVPALALLALTVLGGAMMPAEIEATSPVTDIRATQEPTSTPRVYERANEPPAPIEVEEAKPVVKRVVAKPTAKRVVGKQRKVVVNTSSALGNLRPRKAW